MESFDKLFPNMKLFFKTTKIIHYLIILNTTVKVTYFIHLLYNKIIFYVYACYLHIDSFIE